jgi:hypothetical protein
MQTSILSRLLLDVPEVSEPSSQLPDLQDRESAEGLVPGVDFTKPFRPKFTSQT